MEDLYGVIDIGSNTIKLSVYKMTNNSLRLIFNNKNIAGLVAYVDKEGFFSEKGIKKIITVLKSYKQILENVKVKDVFVIATASLRNIQNSEEVLKKINEFTGYQVDLISGEEEAIYDFIGATHAIGVVGQLPPARAYQHSGPVVRPAVELRHVPGRGHPREAPAVCLDHVEVAVA